ncbi:A/G-specific adenine glycosylase [Neomicrococcus lactis]
MQKRKETVDTSILTQAHERINGWFVASARDLPWRRPDATPWGIMVSEFMLQQTPVVRVLPVWHEWMRRWPTPALLAAEPSGEAVRAWGRLGYPRRALRLHAAAQKIVEEYDGAVPGSPEALLSLPGIGGYTAAAISSFAFRIPEVVVDTNIRRVHARLFTGNALPEPSLTAAENALAAEVMPAEVTEANTWNAAVMELGAVVCTARSPKCADCPVLDLCAWVAAGKPEPHYVPKGQSWHGTDRQVRGAIMGVLRVVPAPVPRMDLVMSADATPPAPPAPQDSGSGTSTVSDLSAQQINDAWTLLSSLTADKEQREKCLNGLLADGLAVETAAGVSLQS